MACIVDGAQAGRLVSSLALPLARGGYLPLVPRSRGFSRTDAAPGKSLPGMLGTAVVVSW